MTTADVLIILAVLVCLLISFLFSGSETALTAHSRAAMMRLEKNGNRRAGIVNRLVAAREQLIGALLIGNNVANIAPLFTLPFASSKCFGKAMTGGTGA